MLSLSLAKRASGVSDTFNQRLTVDCNFLNQARRAVGFCELERSAGCSLHPGCTAGKVDVRLASWWADNTVCGINASSANRIFKSGPI